MWIFRRIRVVILVEKSEVKRALEAENIIAFPAHPDNSCWKAILGKGFI